MVPPGFRPSRQPRAKPRRMASDRFSRRCTVERSIPSSPGDLRLAQSLDIVQFGDLAQRFGQLGIDANGEDVVVESDIGVIVRRRPGRASRFISSRLLVRF